MNISKGDTAPDFELSGTPAEPVQLSDFRGEQNVLLLFFPLAWSPVCTEELCSVQENYSQYQDLDAQILGISVDSPFALKAWAEDQGFDFPLLSDFNKEVSQRYGAFHEDLLGLKGVSQRAAFVIDKDGVVQHAEVLDSPKNLPDFDAIRSALEAAG